VEFIDNIITEGQTVPVLIFPYKIGIDHLRSFMDALRLITGCRVGSLYLTIQPIKIETAGLYIVNNSMMIALILSLQGY
jgi:hypothetical protein